MARIIVSEFITVDGVFEDPGSAKKLPHGGWSLRNFSEEYGKFKADELFSAEALLLGRTTYEEFAATWPTRDNSDPFTLRMNTLPKYVVGGVDTDAGAWQNTTLLAPGVQTAVTSLKQQVKGNILVAGSGQLVRSLLGAGLVDELRLMVHPVILGEGKRLFDDATYQSLKHTHTQSFTSGTVVLTYQPQPTESNI